MTSGQLFLTVILQVGALLSLQCSAYSAPKPFLAGPTKDTTVSRRNVVSTILSGAFTMASASKVEAASDSLLVVGEEEEMIDVYFGCGCFWHVQHEFVEAEKKILNRKDSSTITARTGYAGGLKSSDRVCYHNAQKIGDYGSLGHAEVVAMRIPPSSFEEFAIEYFKLFNDKGERPDQNGDRGPEYRNLIGIPGGAKSPYAKQVVSASQAVGDKLDFAVGKGNDADARAVSFIMDTQKFPFFVAEQYHQFHDGFNLNENYPNSYNSLASKLAADGKLEASTCPNGLLGIGALGL